MLCGMLRFSLKTRAGCRIRGEIDCVHAFDVQVAVLDILNCRNFPGSHELVDLLGFELPETGRESGKGENWMPVPRG